MFGCNYICACGLYAHATQILFQFFLVLLLYFSSFIFTKGTVVLLSSLLMLSWHRANRYAVWRNTSEALAIHLGRCLTSGDVSLCPRCPVVRWTLKCGSPCQEITASSAGRTLWAWAMNSIVGMWGKQQWVQNFRLKSLVNAVSCELAPELEHLKMQFHGSVSGFKRVVLQNTVNHHSQWSVASCFVMGKCIVGQVSSKPPADIHKSTVFRKCVGSADYTLTPHGLLSCVLTLPTSRHRHDWCSRG